MKIMKKIKSSGLWMVMVLFFVMGINPANAQNKVQTYTGGRGVIVGKDGAAFKLNPNGNPIEDAEIFIVPDTGNNEKVKKTDHLGTYHFKNLKPGKYTIGCKLPGSSKEWSLKAESVKPQRLHVNLVIEGAQKGPITFGSKTGKNPLCFDFPDFNLEKESGSLVFIVIVSVNNYGINDEGIK